MKKDAALDGTEIMTVTDVAKYLRIHPITVYRFLKGGEIPAFRLGFDWRFRRADIDEWIARRQVAVGGGRGVEQAAPAGAR